MLAVDLGATNPVASAVYRVSQQGAELRSERVETFRLSDELIRELASYRRAHDALQLAIRDEARATLSAEQQEEITRVLGCAAGDARNTLCAALELEPTAVDWGAMTTTSTMISRALKDRGAHADAYTCVAGKAAKIVLTTDARWAHSVRPQLGPRTRAAWNEAIWELQRASSEYRKLSQRKRELVRRVVNWTLDYARRRPACKTVVVAIEYLTVRFFHGGGKREEGWSAFFQPRKEARWLIQALHRAYADLGPMRGSS